MVDSGLEALPYTVIRIKAGDTANPNAFHVGTGFFYVIRVDDNDVPLIVSNKHVISGKAWLEFDFASMDQHQNRIFGPPNLVRLPRGALPIIEHPNAAVDIAAVPLNPILENLRGQGHTPHVLTLRQDNLPPAHIQAALHAATSVLMIGFPNGIVDEINNLPVVRRGTLATPYKADYMGQSNFVVDIAVFPGSSGSPIFGYFEGIVPAENGNVKLTSGPEAFLIGILHSGPVVTNEGQVIPQPAPTSTLVARTNLMMHLGYCAKAFRIEELAPVIRQFL
jgi:hypothetical protein